MSDIRKLMEALNKINEDPRANNDAGVGYVVHIQGEGYSTRIKGKIADPDLGKAVIYHSPNTPNLVVLRRTIYPGKKVTVKKVRIVIDE